jgi:hypothetical protein
VYLETPPPLSAILEKNGAGKLMEVVDAPGDPRAGENYLHWDKLRRLEPPEGISSEVSPWTRWSRLSTRRGNVSWSTR